MTPATFPDTIPAFSHSPLTAPIALADVSERCAPQRYRYQWRHDENASHPYEGDDCIAVVCAMQRHRWGNSKHRTREDADRYYAGWHRFTIAGYEHSGLTITLSASDDDGDGDGRGPFSCPWDSGTAGYVYVSPEIIEDREKARASARGVVEDVNAWINGDVWECVQIFDGGDDDGKTDESVSELYPYFDRGGDDFPDHVLEFFPDEDADKIRAAWEARYDAAR